MFDFIESLANSTYMNFRNIRGSQNVDVSFSLAPLPAPVVYGKDGRLSSKFVDIYNFSFLVVRFSSAQRILSMLRIQPKDYMMLIANLTKDLTRQDHQEFRVRTLANLEYIRTLQTLTEYGICYTTNSLIAPNLTTR